MTVDSRFPWDPGRLYLGWQYAMVYPDPGPPPKRPVPPEQHQVRPEWMEAQRREESQLNRPLLVAAMVALAMAASFGLLGWPLGAVPGWGAAVAIGVCVVLAGVAAYAIWQGERALRVRLADEQDRLERLRADRERAMHAAQQEHARRFDAWRAHKAAHDSQYQWYGVSLPREVQRIDVAGGTAPGWRALLTTMGATCLDAGRQVTVVDLTGAAVATDLLELARDREPRVWRLPEDLPGLGLGTGLDAEAFRDVLSLLVDGTEERGPRESSVDGAILDRIVEVFDGRASIAHVAAALRALARIGHTDDDVRRGLLNRDRLDRLWRAFGPGISERVVRERVWALEAQLRKLEPLGSEAVPGSPAQLRVASVSGTGDAPGAAVAGHTALGDHTLGMLGTYLTIAVLHELRRGPGAEAWSHALFLCGAERLRADVLDRLHGDSELSGAGLVMMYRSLPRHVRQRLGSGESAVAFMRLGRTDDAKVASEYIGTGHRLVLNQLTESINSSITDSQGDSELSRSPAAEDHESARGREKGTLASGVPTGTWWGRFTSRVVGREEPVVHAMRRSREFVAEPRELQRLPASAFILSHRSAAGHRVVCGDANPAIMSLPQATHRALEELGHEAAARSGESALASRERGPARGERGSGEREPAPEEPQLAPGERAAEEPRRQRQSERPAQHTPEELSRLPPNLGPPPERLDWRQRRGR